MLVLSTEVIFFFLSCIKPSKLKFSQQGESVFQLLNFSDAFFEIG